MQRGLHCWGDSLVASCWTEWLNGASIAGGWGRYIYDTV